jgi:hypothetical protein
MARGYYRISHTPRRSWRAVDGESRTCGGVEEGKWTWVGVGVARVAR